MEESALLRTIHSKEKELNLQNITLFGVPIWRIVRYKTRLDYINKQVGYVARTTPAKMVGKRRVKLFSGFWKYLFQHGLNVFFPFNRLVVNNGFYLDKFIDPVIDESELCHNRFVIVDPAGYEGDYPRNHKDHTVSNESRTVSLLFLEVLFRVLSPIIYKKRVNVLYEKVRQPFCLEKDYYKQFYNPIALFVARYYYYLLWFRLLKPRRVFIVYREGYFPVIAVCKKLGIPIAEFQHGITLDNTVSFTGEYDGRIDPDYFLTFGDYWKGPQFGMSLDRMVNIGWAYSKYLAKKFDEVNKNKDNDVLVISSPEISDSILDAIKELSMAKGVFRFHIRLHPCESYNEKQKEKLANIACAEVVDNKIDSALVLPSYKYVVGENSSVIYEALSMGCKVGMLNLCGLRPAIELPGIKESFCVINNADDFENFLSDRESNNKINGGFYSEFDNKRFMDFIEKSM